MNREIKFRAFDTENKEMLEVQELDYENSWNGQPMIRTTMYNDYFDTEEMILMQYTGLKDKNGVEIYEGDIVYVVSEDENAEVVWDKDACKFILDFDDDWESDFDHFYGKDLEVIKTIYDS